MHQGDEIVVVRGSEPERRLIIRTTLCNTLSETVSPEVVTESIRHVYGNTEDVLLKEYIVSRQ